jgi:glycosyltransferase involved in cell wall biosynthesis
MFRHVFSKSDCIQKRRGKKTVRIALYEITSTVFYGGIQTFVWGLANSLACRGHTIHIYGGRGNVEFEIRNGVEIFKFPYLSRKKIPNFGTRFRKFAERISFSIFTIIPLIKNHYDLIYVHKPYDMPIALFASRLSGAKVAFGSGGTEFFPCYKYFIKQLDYFFACSEYNTSEIERYCGIRPQVLYNGIDINIFSPQRPDNTLRRSLALKDNQRVLMSACRLVGWKGIHYAIKAVTILSKKYIIIGEGEFEEELKNLTRKNKMQDKILFLGSLPNKDLPKYYSIADIAVFPSIADETFGISIAEAMACRVPVISTTVGGIPEVVANGTGLLVPPNDEDSLAMAMETLLFDDDLRERIGSAGRKWVLENFSWDVIVEKFERYLNNA